MDCKITEAGKLLSASPQHTRATPPKLMKPHPPKLHNIIKITNNNKYCYTVILSPSARELHLIKNEMTFSGFSGNVFSSLISIIDRYPNLKICAFDRQKVSSALP